VDNRGFSIYGLKAFVGAQLPFPLYSAAYALVRESPRRRWRAAKMKQLGLEDWSVIDLSAYKRSDTLFVLGSGASINRITDRRLAAVARHDSVGWNFWVCHPLVPTLYLFEDVKVESSPVGTREWRIDVLDRLVDEMSRRSDYASVPKFLDELRPQERLLEEKLPLHFQQRLYAANTLMYPARSYHELRLTLRSLGVRGTFAAQTRLPTLPKVGFTLGTILSIAICLRYRRIILCGVDVTSPGYFYEDADRYPRMKAFRSSVAGSTHLSSQVLGLRCRFPDFVRALRDEVMIPLGIELFVESRTSGLYPEVPEAPESVFV
jgi:hypothetical protein